MRYVVVGAGIVGLATARALLVSEPDAEVTVVEKEFSVANHQTGHNSGVIHSGIYYKPGTRKASMCPRGARSMIEFAKANEIPFKETGKLIVAVDNSELARLKQLYEQGRANGVPVTMMDSSEALEYEPHVACIRAIRVASAAIIDYGAVARAIAADIVARGGTVRTGCTVLRTSRVGSETVVETSLGELGADVVVSCAGLYADRVAAMDASSTAKLTDNVVPFRGEYYELRPEKTFLVNGLIYPVPDPAFPFLGVHLTRMIGGGVHAGPNAVLALAREGYRWQNVNRRDLFELIRSPGVWRLAKRNFRVGIAEIKRSLSKKAFAESVGRLVPGIGIDDLLPSSAGVRAHALSRDGKLLDDFVVVRRGRNIHVLNAPSPAATSAFEVGAHIADLAQHASQALP